MLKRLLAVGCVALAFSTVSVLPGQPNSIRAAAQNPPQTSTMTAGNPEPTIRPLPSTYRFANGQVLHYAAEWRLVSAGTATIRMDAVGSEQRVTATADSSGVVALLYKVQDRFESFFDHRSFCSSRINKHSEEGLHKRETSIRFDSIRRKAILDEKNLKNNETKHTEQDIPPCVTDVLSGIYYLGSLPLEPGTTHYFPLNDGGQTVTVRAYVEGREELKTDAGTFRTVRVQPSSDSGVLKSRGKIWIWYTDDSAHLPVQMRARMFWGTLTFTLKRVDRQQ